MRVLVTRPLPAAETTARRLEAAGHEAILLPLMQATHLPAAARSALAVPHAALVLTSAETLRVLASLGKSLTAQLATPCYCVGEATARAAEELGFTDIRIGAGTGEALAGLIASTIATLPKQPLLYLTGTPRSDGLENALRQGGIGHQVVECYRMQAVADAPDALRRTVSTAPFDAVLLYSRETARRLADLLSEAGLTAPHFASRYLCLSAAIAEALPRDVMCEIAAKPDEESLFRIL